MQNLIRDLNLFCFDDDGCAIVAQKSNKIGPNRIIYWPAQFFAAMSYMTIHALKLYVVGMSKYLNVL